MNVSVKDYHKHLVLPLFVCKTEAMVKQEMNTRVLLCKIFWRKLGFIIQLQKSSDYYGWLKNKVVKEIDAEKMLKYLDFLMKTFLLNTAGISVKNR